MQGRYLGRVGQRFLQALASILSIIIVTFLLTRMMPGDPAMPGTGLAVQIWSYIAHLMQGDLGRSLSTGTPVLEALANRLPASLALMFSGLLVAIVLAVPVGMAAALWPDSWIDRVGRWIAMAGQSIPVLFAGLLFLYLFENVLGWALPSRPHGLSGVDGPLTDGVARFGSTLRQLALPAVTLGLVALAPLVRSVRDAWGQVLASPFIRVARANGLNRRQILWTYALRNAMLPVLSAAGPVFSLLLGANILVEHVFAWPGMGTFATGALAASDIAAVQGVVLVMAVLYVLLKLGIEVLCAHMDPRL